MRRIQGGSRSVRRPMLRALAAGALAFCCVVVLVLVDVAISRRSASQLFSEADWAELRGLDQMSTTAPVQFHAADANDTGPRGPAQRSVTTPVVARRR